MSSRPLPLPLAHEKDLLLMRSALCRLRLRRHAHGVRVALVPGIARGSRLALLAGRIVIFAKLARPVIAVLRALRSS